MKKQTIESILYKNSNSRCRRYLLGDGKGIDKDCQELTTKIVNTLAVLGDLRFGQHVIVEELTFDMNEYVLPNSKLKLALESSHVYLFPTSIGFKDPIIKSEKSGVKKADKFATPTEVKIFFNEYYSYLNRNVEYSSFSKNNSLVLADIHSTQMKDSEGNRGVILIGGSLIGEDVCMLNSYLWQVPDNYSAFARNVSWAMTSDDTHLIGMI